MQKPFRVRGYIPLGAIPRVEMPAPEPIVEPVDHRTAWERDVEEEQKKVALRVKRAQAEREAAAQAKQAEENRKMKRGAYLTAEILIEQQVFSVYGISPDDQKRIETEITNLGLWARPAEAIEFATGECLRLRAAKSEADEAGVAKIRDLCDEAEWAQVQRTIAEHAHEFDPAEIASGAAADLIYRRLFLD
jgi:peptidyl-tRNA hydrolase